MVIFLLACAFITDEEQQTRRDRDGDGEQALVFGGSDCDDDNPLINAAASEICNGLDGAMRARPWTSRAARPPSATQSSPATATTPTPR